MEENDDLSLLDVDPLTVGGEIPRIYLATPLTNVDEGDRRALKSHVNNVVQRVEQVTSGDRVDGERWPVSVYAPIKHTPPWGNDGLSARQVHDRNLTELLDSDALIVIAEKSASAGVGQEIEWAARTGMPILYLYCGDLLSRQIEGIPADITFQSYGEDFDLMETKVEHFLVHRRLAIQEGPRRRDGRRMRFTALTAQLFLAWNQHHNKTDLALNLGLTIGAIDSMLADSLRVAAMPVDVLLMLSAELGISPVGSRFQLSIPDTRALVKAAELYGWDDDKTRRMRAFGLEQLAADPNLRLDAPERWRDLLPADEV